MKRSKTAFSVENSFQDLEQFGKRGDLVIGAHGGGIFAAVGVQPAAVYPRARRARDVRLQGIPTRAKGFFA